METVTAGNFSYDPFAPAVMSNPLPYYKVLRDDHPAYFIPEYDAFFFSRFEDVVTLLGIGDNALISSETALPFPDYLRSHRNETAPPMPSTNPMAPGPMLASPQYEEMRLAHIKPLRPKNIASLRALMQKIARDRLDVLLPRRNWDLVTEFGGILTASITCHLFDLPATVAPDILNTVNEIVRFDPEKNAVDLPYLFSQVKNYIAPAIQARRAAGADGSNMLIDGLIAYRSGADGRALTDEEIADQLVCVVVGNTESVPKIAAHGLLELLNDPRQLAEVRADLETNVAIAANEMVRYCAPAQFSFRTAHKDITIAGQRVRAGQRVVALVYSAARDERVFEDADRFIWNRSNQRVISFGYGQHHCIGKHLALMEIRTIVQEFLSRVERFHFDMAGAVRNPSYFQWGWNNLPVVIED